MTIIGTEAEFKAKNTFTGIDPLNEIKDLN